MEDWKKKRPLKFFKMQLLERKQSFDLFEGETSSGNLQRLWKSSFDGSIEIPAKMRNCKRCPQSETNTNGICEKKLVTIKNLKPT